MPRVERVALIFASRVRLKRQLQFTTILHRIYLRHLINYYRYVIIQSKQTNTEKLSGGDIGNEFSGISWN